MTIHMNYDPTNRKNDYLSRKEVSDALEFVRKSFVTGNPKLESTLKIVEYAENKRRQFITDGKDLNSLEDELLELNREFGNKFGHWFHINNEYYNKFYDFIDNERSQNGER